LARGLGQDIGKHIGNFEDRHVARGCRTFPILFVTHGVKQLLDGRRKIPAEILDHDPGPQLLDPFRVVALMRHRPGVPLDNHRQLLRERLAEAAGPRLTDEEVRDLHIQRNLFREALHHHRNLLLECFQFPGDGLVLAADQDQLHVAFGLVQGLSDLHHLC